MQFGDHGGVILLAIHQIIKPADELFNGVGINSLSIASMKCCDMQVASVYPLAHLTISYMVVFEELINHHHTPVGNER